MTLLDQLAELVTISSLFGSFLLGVVIGAFYGYELEPFRPPHYPIRMWAVGVAFIVFFTVWSVASQAPFQPIYQVGRGILWTVVCAAIPIGRFTRQLVGR